MKSKHDLKTSLFNLKGIMENPNCTPRSPDPLSALFWTTIAVFGIVYALLGKFLVHKVLLFLIFTRSSRLSMSTCHRILEWLAGWSQYCISSTGLQSNINGKPS